MKEVVIMKSQNFEISFSAGQIQDSLPCLLLKDLLPYLKPKSVTTLFQLFTLVPFCFALLRSNFAPSGTHPSLNFFSASAAYLVQAVVFLRLGSEYEHRFGSKYFLGMLGVTIATELIGQLVLGFLRWELFLGPGGLGICVLLVVDASPFKEGQSRGFQEERTVENYDLLGLNDTIVKLNSKEHNFHYESFSNKEFYAHNIGPRQHRQRSTYQKSKMARKARSVPSGIEPGIDSSQELLATKLFKLILLQLIIFSTWPLQDFLVFLLSEALLYSIASSRLLKALL